MAALEEITPVTLRILIYDLSENHLAEQQGIEAGFYYTFPLEDDDSDALIVAGPYESAEAAREAAVAFATDAINGIAKDFHDEEENENAVSEQ